MVFDKKAYNREYYRTHKSLWEKYREDGGGNTTYTTASPLYTPKGSPNNSARRGIRSQLANQRYGAYGNEIAKSEAEKKRREHSVRSSNEAIQRRKRSEDAANRYSEISKGRRREEYLKKTFDEPWNWYTHDRNNPALKYDAKKDRYVGRGKAGTAIEKIKRPIKRAAGEYADLYKSGIRSIKSGAENAKASVNKGLHSYTKAWKSGAKDISKKAQKARKKVTNFIKRLFG